MHFQEVFLGFSVGCLMVAFIIWKLVLGGMLCAKLPKRLDAPELPAEVLKVLIGGLRSEMKETANWFNRVLQWVFMLSHPKGVLLWDRFVWNEFRELPHDIRRLPLGYFVSDGRLIDYYFGTHFPVFTSMFTHKLEAEDRQCLVVVSDLEYAGELEMHMQLDTIFGRSIDIYVSLKSVRGKFHVVLFGDCLYYGFHPEGFEVTFNARLVVDEWWETSWLNSLLSKYAFPLLYKSKFVMPNMKGKWLKNVPEQPPYPWDENVHELYTWTPK